MPLPKKQINLRLKRSLEVRPLDMFLLELVRGGLVTPYDWQTRARTSLGASLPAARRLVMAGLLKRTVDGPRGRHEYALTARGRDEVDSLDGYLEEALATQPTDTESSIRLACLAAAINDDRLAKKFLWNASKVARKRSAAMKKSKFQIRSSPGLARLYSAVLNDYEADHKVCSGSRVAIAGRQLEGFHGVRL